MDKDHNKREEHQKLAAFIKGVHKHLRRKFRESNGDHEAVWESHSQDTEVLKSYGDAMKQLAEDHWSHYSDSRIQWCYDVIVEYYFSGGLQRALEKDAKHQFFESQRKNQSHSCESRSQPNLTPMKEELGDNGCDVTDPEKRPDGCHPERLMVEPVPVPTTGIHLLDVGSCFNPFKGFDHLDPLAIDLCPADDSVLQCDFLQLELITNDHDDTSDFFNRLKSPVLQLPVHSFEVVVFCLLLEYLPSPIQRMQCCIKAVRLLRRNGLLLLITPDSKSSYRNAPMMKSWRTALASVGMARWKYHKMQHLHCMAFRKISQDEFSDSSALEKELAPMMYIPQDFNDACYDDVGGKQRDGSGVCDDDDDNDEEENETFRSLAFEALPMCQCGDE